MDSNSVRKYNRSRALSMTMASWLSVSTCTGPGPTPEDLSLRALEWLIFILFSPCTQYILQAACHVFFFLLLALFRLRPLITSSPSTASRSGTDDSFQQSEASPGALFFVTISVLSLYRLLALVALGFHICLYLSGGAELYEVLLSVLRAFAWSSFTIIVGHEIPCQITRHPRVLRAWWFFNSVLAIFLFILAITAVVAIVTFATCLLIKTELTASKVFTVISVFNILSEQAKVSFSQKSVSLSRLDKFMQSTELENYVDRDAPKEPGCAIVVEGGEFTWESETSSPSLRDINLRIPQGHLVAIVGTVGAGKSSLLAALLGEMPKISGTVQVYGSTAYVPQTAWIQRGTVEENILFGMPMDRTRYKNTLKACSLETDIALFESGDQTETGERGIDLSRGQKQRVQLARAVYQDSDVYFLDDVFSAVDAYTGSAVFKDWSPPKQDKDFGDTPSRVSPQGRPYSGGK